MGVDGLLPFVSSALSEAHVSSFKGKAVAVDASGWPDGHDEENHEPPCTQLGDGVDVLDHDASQPLPGGEDAAQGA